MAAARVIQHNSFNQHVHEHPEESGGAVIEYDLPNGDALIFPTGRKAVERLHEQLGKMLKKPVEAKSGDVEAEAAAARAAGGAKGVDLSAAKKKARRS